MAKPKTSRARSKSPQPVNPLAKPLVISAESAKYNGYEPEWADVELTDSNRQTHMMHAFNWYNYNFTSKDAKAFVLEYLKINKRPKDYKGFKKAKDNAIANAFGYLARMTFMGWKFNETEQANFDAAIGRAIEASINNVEEVTEEAPVAPASKFNIRDRMREKSAEAGGELEAMLDDYIAQGVKPKHTFSPIAVLKAANILPAHASDEIKYWEGVRDEFKDAHAGKDADLVEGYNHFTKIQLRNLVKFCDLIVTDYHGYVAFKKANKKVRKRKVKSPIELARKLKFMPEAKELNLTSVKPAQIVGAKEMFAYDVKKRKLMYFIADEYAGALSIKNNTIDGFDATKSKQKTVRKPAEQLKAFMAASRPNTRKMYTNTKSVETKLSGRFNENVVILKVF